MIMKKTIYGQGTDTYSVAANINLQLKDYLVSTNLFEVASVEEGNGGFPRYKLRYRDSDYFLVLQCFKIISSRDYYILPGVIRGNLDEVAITEMLNYGSKESSMITIHLVTSGKSMAFKLYNGNGDVCFGGSCLRYTEFTGTEGYLYNANESRTKLGFMGRYEIEKGVIAQISFNDYMAQDRAVITNCPIIKKNGAAIGYANDIAIINTSHLADNSSFSLYQVGNREYHGGKIPTDWHSSYVSVYAAAVMRNN